ncbi:hypothetical protein HDU67_007930 [Dinochytrium kinnereticum]|nr:hypothetical protein HDU67_007930 [Dinochytrium kinnereticum]
MPMAWMLDQSSTEKPLPTPTPSPFAVSSLISLPSPSGPSPAIRRISGRVHDLLNPVSTALAKDKVMMEKAISVAKVAVVSVSSTSGLGPIEDEEILASGDLKMTEAAIAAHQAQAKKHAEAAAAAAASRDAILRAAGITDNDDDVPEGAIAAATEIVLTTLREKLKRARTQNRSKGELNDDEDASRKKLRIEPSTVSTIPSPSDCSPGSITPSSVNALPPLSSLCHSGPNHRGFHSIAPNPANRFAPKILSPLSLSSYALGRSTEPAVPLHSTLPSYTAKSDEIVPQVNPSLFARTPVFDLERRDQPVTTIPPMLLAGAAGGHPNPGPVQMSFSADGTIDVSESHVDTQMSERQLEKPMDAPVKEDVKPINPVAVQVASNPILIPGKPITMTANIPASKAAPVAAPGKPIAKPRAGGSKQKRKEKANLTAFEKATASLVAYKTPQKRRRWEQDELLALEEGMKVHGTHWAGLLSDPLFKDRLKDRGQMQLKDKAATEKERRVRAARKMFGRDPSDEELGIWRVACDRKRVVDILPPLTS